MQRVVALLTPHLERSEKALPRAQTPAHMMLGMAHRQLGNWNLASTHFWRIRTTEHPLARWAAWYEAEADRERGRPQSTIAECTEIRTKWPGTDQADECLLLMGDAWADRKDRAQATAQFDQWLAAHTGSPRVEEVQLKKALAIARVSPGHGIPQLQRLVVNHTYHSTAEAAQTALDELGEGGHKVALATGTRTQIRRINSEMRCGRLPAAWDMFQKLQESEDTGAQRWTQANEERVAKGTRQWEHYATLLEQRYKARPESGLAWSTFRAWSRAGRWDKAVELGQKCFKEYGRRGRWSGARDDLAWAETHLGDFSAAHQHWAKLADGRGALGKRAQFYAAYTAFQAGDLDVARKAFGKVVDSGRAWRAAGYYWRAKVREAQEDHRGAQSDRLQAISQDTTGWYSTLLSSTTASDGEGWLVHDGRWHRPPAPTLPTFTAPESRATVSMVPWRSSSLEAPELSWPAGLEPGVAQLPDPAPVNAPTLVSIPTPIQDGYRPSTWYRPEEAADGFRRFADKHTDLWPGLPAAHDLALAGLVTESAPLLSAAYNEWKKPHSRKPSNPERIARVRTIKLPLKSWRQYFALTRDHYHTAISSMGLARKTEDETDARDADRLAYPLVDSAALGAHGARHDVDPLLMMGIMRQESTYRVTIKSHAGAIGLVQVMPATGARLAWLMGDPHYSPGALAQPSINLRYGTYYMSLLLNRFDGVFPMAVASYNGGPHNVSRWVRNHQGKIEIDAWVEQIPWKETRNYVKKVVGHYARYVELYGEPNSVLVLPERPLGDDPNVVNF